MSSPLPYTLVLIAIEKEPFGRPRQRLLTNIILYYIILLTFEKKQHVIKTYWIL